MAESRRNESVADRAAGVPGTERIVRKRTQARELALKALYQRDVRGELPEIGLQTLGEIDEPTPEVLAFGHDLIEDCVRRLEEIDRMIEETAENWSLDRMPTIDRNILRLATLELVFRTGTPPKVAINEAIELAKKFSTENSPTYVNGILDRILNRHAAHRLGTRQDDGADREPDETDPGQEDDPFATIAPDPQGRVDLHVHSTASDGSFAPEEIVRMAARSDLAGVAIVDHDTIEGLAAAATVAEEVGILLVPGVELTAYEDGGGREDKEYEIHILGYFVNPQSRLLAGGLERFRHVRTARIEQIARELNALGVPHDPAEVLRRAPGGSVGRPHVAQELVRLGHCATVQEAFDLYLATGAPAYVHKERLTPVQAINLIHAAGGCAVLAHPGITPRPEGILEELTSVGLDGVEVHCPPHTPEDEKRFMDAARRLDLVVTGGSDFHGEPKPRIRMGQEAVSLVEVRDLADRRRRRVRDAAGLGQGR